MPEREFVGTVSFRDDRGFSVPLINISTANERER
jgi:hypothetical protein